MKLIHRVGYYLGGVGIGLIILFFFLGGKKASCDYGPNARTVKNISSKPIDYSNEAALVIQNRQLDSLTVVQLIKYGDVDFSLSDTKAEGCKTYHIDNTYKEQPVSLTVKNCDSTATVLKLLFK